MNLKRPTPRHSITNVAEVKDRERKSHWYKKLYVGKEKKKYIYIYIKENLNNVVRR